MKLFKRSAQKPKHQNVSRIQLAAACLGVAVIASCSAILVIETLEASPDAVPVIGETAITRLGGSQKIEVTVVNPASHTLSDVSVTASSGELKQSVVLDYLPAKGRRTMTFVIPAEDGVAFTVDHWTKP